MTRHHNALLPVSQETQEEWRRNPDEPVRITCPNAHIVYADMDDITGVRWMDRLVRYVEGVSAP